MISVQTKSGHWYDLSGFDAFEAFEALFPLVVDWEAESSVAIPRFSDIKTWGADKVWQLNEAMEDLPGDEQDALAAYMAYDPSMEIPQHFGDVYRGHWTDLRDYALELFSDLYHEIKIPDNYTVEPKMADFEVDYFTVDAHGWGVYVFDKSAG